ncbi:hypothetical protein [Escherichia phage vB_EcoM_JNE01]|nr:hypothetical protein [Escherichia phage vB_EcoM_JNE01]
MYALYNKEKKRFAKVEIFIDTFDMLEYCIITDTYEALYYVLDDVSVLQRLLERSKSTCQGIHDGSSYETPDCPHGQLDGYEIVKLGIIE